MMVIKSYWDYFITKKYNRLKFFNYLFISKKSYTFALLKDKDNNIDWQH